MILTFPPELTDRMIDFLHDNPSALFRCALTCTTWLPTSLFHLYRTTTYFLGSGKQLVALQSLVSTTNERSATHRRSLGTLIVSGTGDAGWTSRVPAVLPSVFPNIHTLVLSSICTAQNSAPPRSWDGWRRSASWRWSKVTFLRIAGSRFRNLKDLQRFVQAFPALSKLRLEGVTYDITAKLGSQEAAAAQIVMKSPALQELSLVADDGKLISGISQWLLDGPTRSSLHSLSLQLDEAKEVHLHDWVDVPPANLENLQICLGNVAVWNAKDIMLFQLSSCTQLQTLSLDMGYEHAMSLLPSLAPECRIRELKLDIIFEDVVPWEDLTDLLELPMFSKLDALDVHCFWGGDDDVLEDEFCEGCEQMMFEELVHHQLRRGVKVSQSMNFMSL